MSNNISRKDALQKLGILAVSPMVPKFIRKAHKSRRPNIIWIIDDQFRADACKREGFPLDTTPFLDQLAHNGTWFNKAYCAAPACVPSRTSMVTGRWPNATRVKSNWNIQNATYKTHIFKVAKSQGYQTALIGKNHTFLSAKDVDYWREYHHLGAANPTTDAEKKFNAYLRSTHFYAHFKPAPFPYQMQQPYRIVSDTQDWIKKIKGKDQPFFIEMSIPEPHNPYQVSEPYYSMFPPDKLPPVKAGAEVLPKLGKKWTLQKQLLDMGYHDYEKHIPRIRSNYYGMMRLVDDQIKRLVNFLKEENLYDNTIIVHVADHGDFVGEYGLIKKGVGVPECLTRIPMVWHGPGILKNYQPRADHVSNVDLMPTFCEIMEAMSSGGNQYSEFSKHEGPGLPEGVDGRSLWPMLTGRQYPKKEFASILVQQGFGGLDYTSLNQLNPYKEGCLTKGKTKFDELNSYSQSGILRMLRKDDWKLVYDMQNRAKLYNLVDDPAELHDLYKEEGYEGKKLELLQDMLGWELRTQDPLPLPHRRYVMRRDPRNYWAPYRDENVE